MTVPHVLATARKRAEPRLTYSSAAPVNPVTVPDRPETMDPVRYRILGTTQVLRPDGRPVPVGGARLRALLTVLALRAGRTVPPGLLVDEVWGGEPPADAPGALQALVGRLRRALGADAIVSAEGGYRLAASSDDIDLHRFERLVGEGTRALADGDPGKAAGVLDDALALWRGPALADLPDHTAEAARQETRRLDALRARHGAALALGHAEQSLPELTALCDTHPLDEPLQALRLRALRDAGRTAHALAGYEDVRRLLANRLGSDPGPELRSLHGELLRPTPDGRGTGPGAGGGNGASRGGGVRLRRPAPAAPGRAVRRRSARGTSPVPRPVPVRTPRPPPPPLRPHPRATSAPASPPSSAAKPTSMPSAGTSPPPGWSPCSAPAVPGRRGCRRRPPRGCAAVRRTGCGWPSSRRSTTPRPSPRPCSPRSAPARPCCTAPAPRPCGPAANGTTTPWSGSPSTAAGAACC